MYKVYHGFQDSWKARNASVALALVEALLASGKTQILIVREDAVVTGRTDFSDCRPDGRLATNVLEIGIMPG